MTCVKTPLLSIAINHVAKDGLEYTVTHKVILDTLNQNSHPIAVTMGDPSGIGPDVSLKSWLLRQEHNLPPFYLISDPAFCRKRSQRLDIAVPLVEIHDPSEAAEIFDKALPVYPLSLETGITAGQANLEAGPSVIKSIRTAVLHIADNKAAAVVTNPIQKSLLYKIGFEHPGHTEYLAALAGEIFGQNNAQAVMMLAANDFYVVPATIHIPLKDVFKTLTTELLIKTAQIVAHDLKKYFAIPAPRLALTGLNPHAGEAGALGSEEDEIIKPAIAHLQANSIDVKGPYPGDTLFHAAARKTYDAAIAMYHDQALIPVKTLYFDIGVNITLGLPFIRTSPDHGTAYDIAGSGKADPRSLIEAIKRAHQMSSHSAAFDMA